MPRYASLIYNGYWWSPERRASTSADRHNATRREWLGPRQALQRRNVYTVSRDSKDTLFDQTIATFDDDGGAYNQADAAGFIKLNALRMRIEARAGRK